MAIFSLIFHFTNVVFPTTLKNGEAAGENGMKPELWPDIPRERFSHERLLSTRERTSSFCLMFAGVQQKALKQFSHDGSELR